MKILMITEKDAANVSLARIAEACILKGHEVVVYAPYYSDNVLMFFSVEIEKHPFSELTKEIMNDFDIIFASTLSVIFLNQKELLTIKKPIFTQNYLINKQVSWGGDICFVPSCKSVASEYDEYLHYSKVGIGEPKYDSKSHARAENKRFLFIDSGHYPFSKVGKQELAKTLVSICKEFPDYELWIKPRFLPGDKVITHRNSVHLYDVIRQVSNNNIPTNMIMLEEHRELQELIEESHTVICMYTTAFVGSYVAGKGLVVLENIPTDDVYDVRLKNFERIRENMEMSGALIDYRSVNDMLPEGVKCSEKYMNFLVDEREESAEKIAEVVEYLYENFYSKERFPEIEGYTYGNYKESMKPVENMTWDKLITIRRVNYILHRMLVLIDFHVKAKLDISLILQKMDNINLSDSELECISKKVYQYRDECIVANRDIMLQDDIDAGILLNAYYLLKQYSEIKNFPKKDIGAYHLFRAFVASEIEKDIPVVKSELEKYFEVSAGREFIKEISDMSNNKMKAYQMLISILVEEAQYEEAKVYLQDMEMAYKEMYLVSDYKEPISDKIQGQRYTYIHWMNGKVNKKDSVLAEIVPDEQILVYGAGEISKQILLKNDLIKEKIVAFIDGFTKATEIENIPIIRLNDIENYSEINTIIVAVPHQHEVIRQEILKKRADARVLSVNELF